MTVTVATVEPLEINAGDTVQWNKTLSDYPADQSWVLNYVFINSKNKFSVAATASGSVHSISISAVTSGAYVAGTYKWVARVSKAAQVVTIGAGQTTVNPNLDALNVSDYRTHVKKTLDAIEAVIEKRASFDQQEYTIGNRALKRTPLKDLMDLRDQYKALYNAELLAQNVNSGKGNKNKILVRFPGK